MSAPVSRDCPRTQTLNDFVRGGLDRNTRRALVEHIAECANCRSLYFAGKPEAKPARRAVFTLAAATAASIVVVVLLLRPVQRLVVPKRGIEALVAAASPTHRLVQPRLTGGFPWAPFGPAMRDDAMTQRRARALSAAALAVQRNAASDPSGQNRHAAAVAYVITGDVRGARSILRTLAEQYTRNPFLWNDLAVAELVLSSNDDTPSQLPYALVAVDAALALDPSLAEARFNRALILETLGLRDQAREAWEAYVRLDGNSEWSDEAREHIGTLGPFPPFRTILDAAYARIASNPASGRELASTYPQEVRIWGETEVLGRWATAYLGGDIVAASKHLHLARIFGSELARARGERMLQSLVAAVDRADASRLSALAGAHLAFREGQSLYRNDRLAEAEQRLTVAASAFARGGSPGELLARYFAANIRFDQGRIGDAEARLRLLLAGAPPEFPAHRAQLLWQLGTVYLAQSRWGMCLDAYTESLTLFERLGEKNYAATVREYLVEVYDQIGRPSAAWPHRLLALRELGREASPRLQLAIASASRAALMAEEWPVVSSFLTLEIEIIQRIDDPVLHADALLRRAKANVQLNKQSAANADLAAARSVIAHVNDPTHRAHMEAIAKSVEASLSRDPAVAIGMLTGAMEFHRTAGRALYLPELLLERGRAFRRIGDDVRAAEDLESAVAELEAHRQSLPSGEDRWGVLHIADQLFAEGIDLALERGDAATSFAYADRARARALLDDFGIAWRRLDAADIPPGTLLVEYASYRHRLTVFTADRRGIRAGSVAVSRQTLSAEIEAFTIAAKQSQRAQLDSAGGALYRRLLQPIEGELEGIRKIVFVPDPILQAIPFAALVDDDGNYLVERFSVSTAPSAALFAELTRRQVRSVGDVLIVTGSNDPGALAAAKRESDAVKENYDHAVHLEGDDATAEAFSQAAVRANVIHFAGHAVPSSGNGSPPYLFLAAGGDGDSRLEYKEIASMRLAKTALVVLAACDTAGGERRTTEGSISIARAFLAAGAESVIATLWPIEDARAAEFFPVFHRHLAGGQTPADALRATQIEWISRSDSSISLWTAVQMIGR